MLLSVIKEDKKQGLVAKTKMAIRNALLLGDSWRSLRATIVWWGTGNLHSLSQRQQRSSTSIKRVREETLWDDTACCYSDARSRYRRSNNARSAVDASTPSPLPGPRSIYHCRQPTIVAAGSCPSLTATRFVSLHYLFL